MTTFTAGGIAMFPKARLDALHDGIFNVAMTLLVLDVRLPEEFHPRDGASSLALCRPPSADRVDQHAHDGADAGSRTWRPFASQADGRDVAGIFRAADDCVELYRFADRNVGSCPQFRLARDRQMGTAQDHYGLTPRRALADQKASSVGRQVIP